MINGRFRHRDIAGYGAVTPSKSAGSVDVVIRRGQPPRHEDGARQVVMPYDIRFGHKSPPPEVTMAVPLARLDRTTATVSVGTLNVS